MIPVTGGAGLIGSSLILDRPLAQCDQPLVKLGRVATNDAQRAIEQEAGR